MRGVEHDHIAVGVLCFQNPCIGDRLLCFCAAVQGKGYLQGLSAVLHGPALRQGVYIFIVKANGIGRSLFIHPDKKHNDHCQYQIKSKYPKSFFTFFFPFFCRSFRILPIPHRLLPPLPLAQFLFSCRPGFLSLYHKKKHKKTPTEPVFSLLVHHRLRFTRSLSSWIEDHTLQRLLHINDGE